MFGLPGETLQKIRDCLAAQPEIIRASLYGSRAMETYKPGSDIDVVIWTDADRNIAARIKDKLENLPTPYTFDVSDYEHIGYAPLKEHIDLVGKEIYTR